MLSRYKSLLRVKNTFYIYHMLCNSYVTNSYIPNVSFFPALSDEARGKWTLELQSGQIAVGPPLFHFCLFSISNFTL
jgi:hypothetical protein